ncbi:MAG: tRNA (cytidine(34)-2'-O)-methyltransferase [Rhizobiaceae bacterium]|nr:tRNA (cytidine(34)-2'-O)-methyltransferase [Rhizobiaceae bacterium]
MPTRAFRIALYQPDIAGNTGTILRTAACLGFGVDLIEPAGFDATDRALRRAGMDYLEMAALTRHVDWAAFLAACRAEGPPRRIVIATTRAETSYRDFTFTPQDTILFGRESAGLPDAIHAMGFPAITIPMHPGARSLNLAISVAIIAAEAERSGERGSKWIHRQRNI